MFLRLTFLGLVLLAIRAQAASELPNCADSPAELLGMDPADLATVVIRPKFDDPSRGVIYVRGRPFIDCIRGAAEGTPRPGTAAGAGLLSLAGGLANAGLSQVAPLLSPSPVVPALPPSPIAKIPAAEPSVSPLAEAPRPTPVPSPGEPARLEDRPITAEMPPPSRREPPAPPPPPGITPTPPPADSPLANHTPSNLNPNLNLNLNPTPTPRLKSVLEEKPLAFLPEESNGRRSHGDNPLPKEIARPVAKNSAVPITRDDIESGLIGAQLRAEEKWNREAEKLLDDPGSSVESLEDQLRRLIALDPDLPTADGSRRPAVPAPPGSSTKAATSAKRPARFTPTKSTLTGDINSAATGENETEPSAGIRRNSDPSDDGAEKLSELSPGAYSNEGTEGNALNDEADEIPIVSRSGGVSPKLIHGLMKRISRIRREEADRDSPVWAGHGPGTYSTDRLGGRPLPARGPASTRPAPPPPVLSPSRLSEAAVAVAVLFLFGFWILRRKRR